MASEAEIERLYQLFVENGGGSLSFSGTNLTPKQYSEAVAASNLTPYEMAQLEARQHQYNKSVALNSIADEIEANNFTNPYAARSAYSSALFSAFAGTTGATNVGLVNNALSGFGSADKALIFAGVLAATDVDLEKVLKIAGLSALGLAMFSSLANHTNNQTANIPETMQNASSLASMNSSFGPAGGPLPPGENDCEDFNDLMGILSGAYDGTLDFIDRVIGDISSLLNSTGIAGLLSSIVSAISGAGGIVGDIITGIASLINGFGNAILKTLGPLVGKVINAIADMTGAIGNEINNIADMAAQLLKKALALVLGSAAIDPCKSRVLMNTGSDAMKDAVTRLNHPLGTGGPHSVGTTTDDRANAEEVKKAMKYSRDEALLEPGVPQSPFTEAANVYIPKDRTIHTVSEVMQTFPNDSKRWRQMEVLSEIWRQVIFDWRGKQVNYIADSRGVIREMQGALYKKDIWSGKSALKDRLLDLINEAQLQQHYISRLVDGVAPDFYYFTPGGVKDETAEALKVDFYNNTKKPAMTRVYNTAVTSLNNTKTEWKSIDSQLYT